MKHQTKWSVLFSFPLLTLTEMDGAPPCDEGVIPHEVSGANVRRKRQTDGPDQGCKHSRQNEWCDSLKQQPVYAQRGRMCCMLCDRHHAVLCEVFSCTFLYCYINLTQILFSWMPSGHVFVQRNTMLEASEVAHSYLQVMRAHFCTIFGLTQLTHLVEI